MAPPITHSRSLLAAVIVVGVLAAVGFGSGLTLYIMKQAQALGVQSVKPTPATTKPAVSALDTPRPIVRSVPPAPVRPAAPTTTGTSVAAPEPAIEPSANPGDVTNDTSSSAEPGISTPTPASVSISIDGSRFSGEQFQPPRIEGPMQLLPHYGTVKSSVELPHGASNATVRLKPRIVADSAPVVDLYLERRVGGKYLLIPLMKDDVITSDTPVSRVIVAEPGTYDVTLNFNKSSKEGRAHLEIHQVEFR